MKLALKMHFKWMLAAMLTKDLAGGNPADRID